MVYGGIGGSIDSYQRQGLSLISSTCVVFAKTEIVGLLEEGVLDNEIIAAYCSAIAHRILELLNRLGVQEKFVIIGGIAKNEGVAKRLEAGSVH